MSTAQKAFETALDPFTREMTLEAAERLASLKFDPSLGERLNDFADRNTEGELSPTELAEYEALVRTVQRLATLRAQARAVVTRQ
jgi:hypothetical protein